MCGIRRPSPARRATHGIRCADPTAAGSPGPPSAPAMRRAHFDMVPAVHFFRRPRNRQGTTLSRRNGTTIPSRFRNPSNIGVFVLAHRLLHALAAWCSLQQIALRYRNIVVLHRLKTWIERLCQPSPTTPQGKKVFKISHNTARKCGLLTVKTTTKCGFYGRNPFLNLMGYGSSSAVAAHGFAFPPSFSRGSRPAPPPACRKKPAGEISPAGRCPRIVAAIRRP
jgi:hypothetical protein